MPHDKKKKPAIAIMIAVKPSKKDSKKKYASNAMPHNVMNKAWQTLKGTQEHQLFTINPNYVKNYADAENYPSDVIQRIGTAHPAIFGTRYGRKPVDYPTPLAAILARDENHGINSKLKPDLRMANTALGAKTRRMQYLQSLGLPNVRTEEPPIGSAQHVIDTQYKDNQKARLGATYKTPNKYDPYWMHDIDVQPENNPLSDEFVSNLRKFDGGGQRQYTLQCQVCKQNKSRTEFNNPQWATEPIGLTSIICQDCEKMLEEVQFDETLRENMFGG